MAKYREIPGLTALGAITEEQYSKHGHFAKDCCQGSTPSIEIAFILGT